MKKVVILILAIALIGCGYFYVSNKDKDQGMPSPKPEVATPVESATVSDPIHEEYSKDEILKKYNTSTIAELDFNNDVIDDLIIKDGISEADYVYYFYTGHNNKYIYVGSSNGGHSTLFYEPNTSYIVKQYGQMGSEIITHLTVENNSLTEKEITNRFLGEGEEYTEFKGMIEFKEQ